MGTEMEAAATYDARQELLRQINARKLQVWNAQAAELALSRQLETVRKTLAREQQRLDEALRQLDAIPFGLGVLR